MLPQSEYDNFVKALNTLYTQINVTSDQRNQVKRTLSSPEATAALAAADDMIAEAKQVYAAGSKLRREMAAAGFTLTVAADNIADKVDELLIDTKPDLNSLLGITANLGTTATALAPGALGRRTTTDLTGALAREVTPQAASEDVDTLRTEIKKLRDAIDAVGVIVSEAAATTDLRASIEGCTVEPPGGGLVVEPGDPQQTMQTGETKRFAVYGSVRSSAALIGEILPGAEIVQGVQNGTPVFDLVTKPEGGAGTLGVAFSDATGQSRTTITVTVEAPAETTADNGGAGAGTPRSVVPECPARDRMTLSDGPLLPDPLAQAEADLTKSEREAIHVL